MLELGDRLDVGGSGGGVVRGLITRGDEVVAAGLAETAEGAIELAQASRRTGRTVSISMASWPSLVGSARDAWVEAAGELERVPTPPSTIRWAHAAFMRELLDDNWPLPGPEWRLFKHTYRNELQVLAAEHELNAARFGTVVP